MKKLKVLSIFGTRPEAVKMAPVIQALQKAEDMDSVVCVTAQHREMLDQVLDLFAIKPDFDLNLMKPDQNLADLTCDILSHLDPVFSHIQPDWVLVQGDTTTVMTAALAAFYRGIHIGHVEAGLRTGDKRQPFPEEINRRMTSVIADLHFAPTELSRQNLLREGIEDGNICVTGNTVVDALNQIAGTEIPGSVTKHLKDWDIGPVEKKLILVTAHRRENFGKPIEDICMALKTLASLHSEKVHIVYPVHLNPHIQEPVHKILDGVQGITLLDPLDYLSLVHLMKASTLVLTDSGGIQEEATSLGIPTLVLREKTERPEGVEAGVLELVGSDKDRIVKETTRLLDDEQVYQRMMKSTNLYGDGQAATRIVKALRDFHSSLQPIN